VQVKTASEQKLHSRIKELNGTVEELERKNLDGFQRQLQPAEPWGSDAEQTMTYEAMEEKVHHAQVGPFCLQQH
jgi:hypothetical protein